MHLSKEIIREAGPIQQLPGQAKFDSHPERSISMQTSQLGRHHIKQDPDDDRAPYHDNYQAAASALDPQSKIAQVDPFHSTRPLGPAHQFSIPHQMKCKESGLQISPLFGKRQYTDHYQKYYNIIFVDMLREITFKTETLGQLEKRAEQKLRDVYGRLFLILRKIKGLSVYRERKWKVQGKEKAKTYQTHQRRDREAQESWGICIERGNGIRSAALC